MEFLKSAKVVSFLILLSRIFGLIRDMATTALLPTGQCSALFLAWTIPNLFRKLFGEGALSAAFIPALARVKGGGRDKETAAFISSVITALTLFLLALMVFFYLLLAVLPESWLLDLFQGDGEMMRTTLSLVKILIPYMIVACVIAQFQGVLNTFGSFAVPALAPVLLNVFWIAAVVVAALAAPADSGLRVFILAWGILFAGAMQVALYLPSLARRGLIPRPRFDWKNPEFRAVLAMTLPMVLALSANQVNILVDRLVVQAYVPGRGGVTHLYVGNRLMQFPFALIGIALMTAVFPLLAKLSSEGDREGMKKNLAGALRINFFLAIPAMVGLVVLAEPIITLFFQHGNFSSASTRDTCNALVGYTVGMPFLSTVVLLTRAFYSMNRWKAPLYAGTALVAVNIVLDFVLVRPLAEGGVALATSITVALQAAVLFVILRRGMGPLGGRLLAAGAGKACFISLLLGGAVYGTDRWLAAAGAADTLSWRALRVGLPILAGLVVYFIPARVLCPFEFGSLLEALRRKTSGGGRGRDGGGPGAEPPAAAGGGGTRKS